MFAGARVHAGFGHWEGWDADFWQWKGWGFVGAGRDGMPIFGSGRDGVLSVPIFALESVPGWVLGGMGRAREK